MIRKIISILLLLSHTSLLFADTLTFKRGLKINGELIRISEEHELDPNTGTTSEVTFKVDKFSIKMVPDDLIIGKLNENTFLFDPISVYKIIDDQGNVLLLRPFRYGSNGEFIEIPLDEKMVNSSIIEVADKALLSIDKGFEVFEGAVNSPQVKGVLILVSCAALFALFLVLENLKDDPLCC